MMRQIGPGLVFLLSLSACSTRPATANPQSAPRAEVRVLYRYPQAGYKILGTSDFDYYYPPNSRVPSVTDALPSLKEKALSVGGNALIVRDHRMCSINRCISISMEVLRVDWSRPGDVQP